MRRLILLVALTLTFHAPATLAQGESCPADHVCVSYNGTLIAIDPVQGFFQQIVVEEHITTITDFDGERTLESAVKVASFQALGNSYELVDERLVEREGVYAQADLGDVYVLGEVT